MSIRKPIFAILAVSTLSAMTQIAFADDDRHECTPKITSTTIAKSNYTPTPPVSVTGASAPVIGLSWIISGSCLQEVTNVSIAKDDGMGYENIVFTAVPNSSLKTTLIVPIVARTGFNNIPNVTPSVGITFGQYLLQVKRCKNVLVGDKCTTFDEKFVFGGGITQIQPL
jgi:hypothetical protein